MDNISVIRKFCESKNSRFLQALSPQIYKLFVERSSVADVSENGNKKISNLVTSYNSRFPRPIRDHAIVYCINSQVSEEEYMYNKDDYLDDLTTSYRSDSGSVIFKESSHGDIIEDQSQNPERANSWSMISRSSDDGGFKVIELSYEFDDYGGPSEIFKSISQFRLDHWDMNRLESISLTGKEMQDYWHSDEPDSHCNLKDIISLSTNVSDIKGDWKSHLSYNFRGESYTLEIDLPLSKITNNIGLNSNLL
jgi:hypothetical protein